MEGAVTLLEPDSATETLDLPADETSVPDFPLEPSSPPPDERADAEGLDDSTEAGRTITPLQIVEALLFASDDPLPAAKIAQVLGVGTARDVRRHVEQLNERFERTGAAVRVQEVAGGYQMRTLPLLHTWLAKLHQTRQETRLSGAAMETLAVVAYKQPVTRADIEAVRGVAAGEMLNRLRELDLIRIVGRAEDLGRPMLYGTTRKFLEVFGLPSLEALPKIESALLSGDMKGAGQSRPADLPVESQAPPAPPESPAPPPADDVAG